MINTKKIEAMNQRRESENKAIKAVESFFEEVGYNTFTQKPKINGISWDTFVKWADIESVYQTTRIYYSLEKIVEMLNNCSGEDCYGQRWEFEIDENGNVYEEVIKDEGYRFRKPNDSVKEK